VNALFVAFIVSSTAILTLVLGVFGGYCAIQGLLAVLDPSRPSPTLSASALVPHQSHASGD